MIINNDHIDPWIICQFNILEIVYKILVRNPIPNFIVGILQEAQWPSAQLDS
jgi:hypothetical protein